MQPIFWRHAPFANMFAPDHFLAHQGDQDGVFHVVVKRVTVGDIFKGHVAGPANDVFVLRFPAAVGTPIALFEAIDKCINQNFRGVKQHRRGGRGRRSQRIRWNPSRL